MLASNCGRSINQLKFIEINSHCKIKGFPLVIKTYRGFISKPYRGF